MTLTNELRGWISTEYSTETAERVETLLAGDGKDMSLLEAISTVESEQANVYSDIRPVINSHLVEKTGTSSATHE